MALALGSGGARGYAHIGAIQVLTERGYEIVSIAGSSMGALVGGLHAAGVLDGYVEWVLTLSQLDVVRLIDPSISSPGAVKAEKVFGRVRDLLAGARIEELAVPFTAVATDLRARREVWFQRGPAYPAIRASIAIPGVFAPVVLDGRLLVDGGLMEPLPVAPTASVRSDLTLAVDLGGERREAMGDDGADGGADDGADDAGTFEEWAERFRHGASQLFDRPMIRALTSRFGSGDDDEPDDERDGEVHEPEPDEPFGPLPRDLSKFNVMNQALETMQHVIKGYRLAGYQPDVVVTVPKDACRTVDFHRAAEMIELGRRLTGAALDSTAAPTGAGGPEPAPPS